MSTKEKSQQRGTLSNSIEFHRLPPEETELFYDGPSKTAKLSKRVIMSLITSLLVAAALSGSYFLGHRAKRVETITCGETNEEAIARGCVMEPMLYGWMPKECYFEKLSRQYTPFEDREWFTGSDYQERVPPEDIWAGKHKQIYAHQYHGQHCLFLSRKLSWAVAQRSEYLDLKTLNVEHTDHCAEVLMDHGAEGKNASNNVKLGFYTCVRMFWA